MRGTGDGAVLYTDSTLALNADTGKIVWFHQYLPRDQWNFDHTFEQVLADIDVDGHPRQALLTLGKPGILWALDRRTGEFLWERETTYQNVYKHIDAETGQVDLNEGLIPSKLDETKFACPSDYGGKLWMATAYNPRSKTLFVPLNNLCMDWKIVAQEPLPGEDYGRGRMEFRHAPNNSGDIGRVDAINLDNKQTQWSHARHPYWTSSLLATAGGVVFGGDANRRLRRRKRDNSLATAAQQPAWRLSDDVHGRRQAIRRHSRGPEPHRQPRHPPVDAGNSRPEQRLDAPGVCAAGQAAGVGARSCSDR